MKINLANGESVIKTWNYAQGEGKEDGKAQHFQSSLTVTNKRLISSVFRKGGAHSGLYTQEIFLEDVKAVSGFYAKKASVAALVICIILAVLSVPAIVYLAFLPSSMLAYRLSFPIRLAFFAVPVLLIFLGILLFNLKKKSSFYLYLSTRGVEGTPMEISANIVGNRKNKTMTNIDIVHVHPAVAEEIVSTLGAIILNHRGERNATPVAAPVVTPQSGVRTLF